MGLNTGQLISGAGAIAESRAEHADTLLDLQQKQLETEALNRRQSDALREQRINRAKVGLEGIDTKDKMATGIAPPEEKTVGLSTGAAVSTASAKSSAASVTGGKAGLKLGGENSSTEKMSKKYGVDFPEEMKGIGRYDKDYIAPQEDEESNLGYGLRKWGSGDQALSAHDFAKGAEVPSFGKFAARFRTDQTSLSSTPKRRAEWGFANDTEADAFSADMKVHSKVIRDWFGEHIGSGEKFEQLSKPKQVQHIKAIMDENRIHIDKDSGLPKEVVAAADSTASTVKAAKKKAGLPATSAIETERPSKQKTILLEGDRGAPRDKALELKKQYEDNAIKIQEEIWVGDDASAKNIAAMELEQAVLKEAYDYSLSVQGLQDFNRAGDPRMMQGIMAKKYGSEVYVQELGNGMYNIMERDKTSGQLVPVHSNVSKEEVTSSFKNLTDEGYVKRFQAMFDKRVELGMKLEYEGALEEIKNKFGMERDAAKTWLDLQTSKAKGEDVKMFNAKLGGRDEFVIQMGNRFFVATPPVETENAGSTAPGMTEIQSPL